MSVCQSRSGDVLVHHRHSLFGNVAELALTAPYQIDFLIYSGVSTGNAEDIMAC